MSAIKQAIESVTGRPRVVEPDARDGDDDGDVIDGADLKWLGAVASRGPMYAVLGQQEFQILGDVRPHELGVERPKGQTWIRHRVSKRVNGRATTEDRVVRALPVPAGTFATLQRLRDRREARLAADAELRSRPHVFDELRQLPALGRIDPAIIPLTPPLRLETEPITEPFEPMKVRLPPKRAVATEERPPVVGARAILAYLQSKNVDLSLTADGQLVVMAKTLDHGDREVILAAEPLLVGLVANTPVPCRLPGHKGTPPEASTLVFPSVPSCEQHARGEL